jgi:hypothetical protein
MHPTRIAENPDMPQVVGVNCVLSPRVIYTVRLRSRQGGCQWLNSGKPEGFGAFPEFMSSSFKIKSDA